MADADAPRLGSLGPEDDDIAAGVDGKVAKADVARSFAARSTAQPLTSPHGSTAHRRASAARRTPRALSTAAARPCPGPRARRGGRRRPPGVRRPTRHLAVRPARAEACVDLVQPRPRRPRGRGGARVGHVERTTVPMTGSASNESTAGRRPAPTAATRVGVARVGRPATEVDARRLRGQRLLAQDRLGRLRDARRVAVAVGSWRAVTSVMARRRS